MGCTAGCVVPEAPPCLFLEDAEETRTAVWLKQLEALEQAGLANAQEVEVIKKEVRGERKDVFGADRVDYSSGNCFSDGAQARR